MTTSGPLAEFRRRPFFRMGSRGGTRSEASAQESMRFHAFDFEQLRFRLHSSVSGKSPRFPAAREDPVTRDDERDRIPSQGLPDRPGSGGPVHVRRKPAVGLGPSCRDFPDRFVHLSREGAHGVQVDDDVQKVLHIPAQMPLDFPDDPGNVGRRHASFCGLRNSPRFSCRSISLSLREAERTSPPAGCGNSPALSRRFRRRPGASRRDNKRLVS